MRGIFIYLKYDYFNVFWHNRLEFCSDQWGVPSGYLFWWICFKLSPKIFGYWLPKYKSLSEYKKTEWDSRFVSSAHALIVLCLIFICFFFDPVWKRDDIPFFQKTSSWGYISAAGALSYWIYDLGLILTHWKILGDYGILFHHIVGVYCFSLGFVYRQFSLYAPLILVTEISTPFVNKRWFMCSFGYYGKFYIANGILLWLAFLFCRVLYLPYLIYHQFSTILSCTYFDYTLMPPIICGTLAVNLLSIYWFYIITRGILKILYAEANTKKKV